MQSWPPRVGRVDAGLVALAVALGALFLLDSLSNEPGKSTASITTDLVVGAVACAALLLRRRWPVTLALTLIPSILVSASAMGATAVAMSAVALYRSRRVTAAVLAWHALFIVALFGLLAGESPQFWEAIVVVLAMDAAMVASGLLVRSQRLLMVSLQERAREAERERLAREMHDVLAHRISLIAVHAGALEVRRSALEEERQAAGVIRQYAYDALEDLRVVIGTADGDDRPQPTLSDLPQLVEQSRLTGTHVTLDNRLVEPVAVGLGRHVYRIVQEALTNARKHAPGEPVHVRIAAGDELVVEVTNPLPSRPVAAQIPGSGSGLIGLDERMNLIGGRLDHLRTPEGEFRLTARLPWRP